MKRVIDVIISSTVIILFSPIFIIIALTIRLTMEKPIFYKQKRPGLDGKPFGLYKFRTMTNTRDANGDLLPDEKRITNLGIFLRKFSLDELPQLINVLKGDMSLVGPRPLLMEYLEFYTKEQFQRHRVKPGITGLAQINGRNAITWEEKFKLDIWYVNNHNLFLDCKILLKTIGKVLKREGITSRDSVSMEKFKGSKEVM